MKNLSGQFRQLLLIICVLFYGGRVDAQIRPAAPTREFKSFSKITVKANVAFNVPEGFKEVQPESAAYDFAIAIPEHLEIWLKVIPQTEASSDSLYLEIGRTQAKLLAGEGNYHIRNLPEYVLGQYNADAGSTFLLSLPDSPTTRRYKYALLITLQKTKKGAIMALCLTNDKGPDFFKNINKAKDCIKFKPAS